MGMLSVPYVSFGCSAKFFCFINHLFSVCSGFNVINVKHGNIKFVLYLMAEEMMVDKLNILALTAIFKR